MTACNWSTMRTFVRRGVGSFRLLHHPLRFGPLNLYGPTRTAARRAATKARKHRNMIVRRAFGAQRAEAARETPTYQT